MTIVKTNVVTNKSEFLHATKSGKIEIQIKS